MDRNLRKGNTTLELVSNNHYESINAIKTNLKLENKILLISTILKPIDENQKEDANCILYENKNALSKIIFKDELIRKKIESFVNAYMNEISYIKLQIFYEKDYFYNVKVTPEGNDKLIMIVQA